MSDPALAALAELVRRALAQLGDDLPADAAHLPGLLDELSAQAGPADLDAVRAQLDDARATLEQALAALPRDLPALSEDEGLDPAQAAALSAQLDAAWRARDGERVDQLIATLEQRMGLEDPKVAERRERVAARVSDAIARNLRARGLKPLTAREAPEE
ncbi:MAG: hypothetical protein H6739_42010 [Alphaproteobacteria bacterium]|nr:hypothetical protein [Alphaproteobacteria bacterium]